MGVDIISARFCSGTINQIYTSLEAAITLLLIIPGPQYSAAWPIIEWIYHGIRQTVDTVWRGVHILRASMHIEAMTACFTTNNYVIAFVCACWAASISMMDGLC